MKIRHVTLQDQSSLNLTRSEVQDVTNALQIQLDRDFTPVWGVHAVVQALNQGENVRANASPMTILDHAVAGLGVHLHQYGKPVAQMQAGDDWSITASHETLEMLVVARGRKSQSDPDIDPGSQ